MRGGTQDEFLGRVVFVGLGMLQALFDCVVAHVEFSSFLGCTTGDI